MLRGGAQFGRLQAFYMFTEQDVVVVNLGELRMLCTSFKVLANHIAIVQSAVRR